MTWLEESKLYKEKLIKKYNLGLFCEELELKDYSKVKQLRDHNPKFKKDTDRLLKDLPEECKYSFEERVWDNYQNYSLFDIYEIMYKDFGSLYNRTKLLLSEDGEEILGWVSLETYKGTMGRRDIVLGVKFGSFNPEPGNTNKNFIFFRQLKKYLKENIDKYDKVYFSGNIEYPFVRHYVDICADYDGIITLGMEDDNYLNFAIGEKIDKDDIDRILTKEEYQNKSPKEIQQLLLKKFN